MDDGLNMPPVAGDQGLLGFTEASPAAAAPATNFGGFDQMGLGGGAEYSPPQMSADLSPPASVDPLNFVGEAAAPSPVAAAPVAQADPFQGMPVPMQGSSGGMSTSGKSIPEVNALREWEIKHEQELEEISRNEEDTKRERKKAASDELTKWYEERDTATKKRMSSNRTDEEAAELARADALKPGANPWERVVDLIDTNARATDESRDTTRMRALLIQLKSTPQKAAA